MVTLVVDWISELYGVVVVLQRLPDGDELGHLLLVDRSARVQLQRGFHNYKIYIGGNLMFLGMAYQNQTYVSSWVRRGDVRLLRIEWNNLAYLHSIYNNGGQPQVRSVWLRIREGIDLEEPR